MGTNKRTAVIVSGYFDPLHIGHLDMLEDAASRGDAVIAIVNNNAQQEMKKGMVISDQADRLRIVSSLRVVDHAFVAVDDDRTVSASIEKAVADHGSTYDDFVFGNGGDRRPEFVPEAAVCERLGIELVFDLGGTDKSDSSSRINMELGLTDQPSPPPSTTT
ncbi:MAG: adenylyltransferase/cytidyltransferase family protein [Acidimicrobiales bacterium]